LPEGYIDPKAERAVRDVWRQRAPLVRQQTANVLSLQNILVRNTGVRLSAKRLHAVPLEEGERRLPEPAQVLAVPSSLAVWHCLGPQINTLEKAVRMRLKHTPADEQLLTVDGIGTLLAQTIVVETGDIGRFSPGGNDAAYCRCVRSTKLSNGTRKGQGNGNNGNPYRAWAYREAAPFAIRCSPQVQRFYQRKQRKSPWMIARKAVAQKLAWAGSDLMCDLVPFEVYKALGGGRAGGGVGVGTGEEQWGRTLPLGAFPPQPMPEGLPPDGGVWRRLCRAP